MMRFFLVASFLLILFPSLLFGQTINECRDRQKLTEMAMEIRDRLRSGESEDSLLMWAGDISSPGIQAAAYQAIDAYTFQTAPQSVSQVAFVMGYKCSKTYRN